MAKTGPRDPEATRSAILTAAEAAFLERGVADVSLSEIAKRAGVTKSLIHHHFGSKLELWEAVKTNRFSEYADQQRALLAASGDDADVLRASVGMYFRFLQRNPDFARLLTWMNLEGEERDFGPADDLILLGAEKIRAGQAAGHLRPDIDPVHAINAFVALCMGWFQTRHHCAPCWRRGQEAAVRRAGGGPVTDEEIDEIYLDTILTIFMEGVLPRG